MGKFILVLSITLMTFAYFNIANMAVAEDLIRTHSGGNVSVVVTLIDVKDLTSVGAKEEFAFKVSLNTHSVDLSVYQMAQISFLRDGEGNEYKAENWDSLSGSSHHRSGILRISNLNGNGDPVISKSSKSIELVIKGLAGIEERVFRWDISE